MKKVFKKLGSRESAVILTLLFIFSAGIILKYSGWKRPENFDYREPDRLFTEKTKQDFQILKEQGLNSLQKERSEDIRKFADSLLAEENSTNSKQLKPGTLININNSYAADLIKLPGIGEVTAERIIEYRDKVNGFKNTEELMNVKGIGKKKFEKIKPYISVE